MPVHSAGLLMCRIYNHHLHYFLIHPGGPYYARKNDGVWSIPKGIPYKEEDLFVAAQREFYEETGINSKGPFHSLDTVKMKSGKILHVWSFLGHWDEHDGIKSNTFTMEWPPKSEKIIEVAEADRAAWLNEDDAIRLINAQQIPFLQRAKNHYLQ